jgi:hypothetical protein
LFSNFGARNKIACSESRLLRVPPIEILCQNEIIKVLISKFHRRSNLTTHLLGNLSSRRCKSGWNFFGSRKISSFGASLLCSWIDVGSQFLVIGPPYSTDNRHRNTVYQCRIKVCWERTDDTTISVEPIFLKMCSKKYQDSQF